MWLIYDLTIDSHPAWVKFVGAVIAPVVIIIFWIILLKEAKDKTKSDGK